MVQSKSGPPRGVPQKLLPQSELLVRGDLRTAHIAAATVPTSEALL